MNPLVLALALSLPLAATDVETTCRAESENDNPCELERALGVYRRGHSEFSFGYLGQWSDETNRALELKPSTSDPAIAGSITEPFLGAPFSGAVLSGASFESRVVHDGLRITAGFRFPFVNFRPSDTSQTVLIGGAPHEVVVRSISLWDFRTGLGFEIPTRRVTPYVDVLGDVEHLTTRVVVDGQQVTYTGTAFSLGGRLGLRAQFKHVFLAIAAEATALGPTRIGGSAQLGVAL